MMLEIRALRAGYDGQDVIHGIDLAVGAAEIVALVGANGAGKSTLAKTISGVLPVRTGEIVFDGQPLAGLDPRQRVSMGIAHVPEGRQVFGGMTVRENLRLGAYVHRRSLDEAALAERMLSVCGIFPMLLDRMDQPVGNFSGGQQQMLAIARGLMSQPRLLVLDEPSLGVAPVLVTEIFRLISRLRAERGLSIILSEQNAKASLAIADRAYVIESGRIALQGTGAELLASPEVAERYLGVSHGVAAAEGAHARLVERINAIFATPSRPAAARVGKRPIAGTPGNGQKRSMT